MSPDSAGIGRMIDPPGPTTESIETPGCTVVLRRVQGPEARELFFHCQPSAEQDAGLQAEALYRAILDVLDAEGGRYPAVVSETLYLRNLEADVDAVREARHRVLAGRGQAAHRPARSEIEQPPLNQRSRLEIMVHAVVAGEASLQVRQIEAPTRCSCAGCEAVQGLRIETGGEIRFHAAGLCGLGDGAYEQTHGMFSLAEEMLHEAGMTFADVLRTWIYLRDIDRDYGDLNRARREFFDARGIDPVPASTGIGGGAFSGTHDICLGVYALKGGRRTVMTSPTLNEASRYGADFVRGMRVDEADKTVLHVSGTASIDERGRTVHGGEFEAQAQRMFVNIAALLQRQGAAFGDVVSAVTYLKDPADAARLARKIREAGFHGFPHALVVAPICRPDLLCETEAVAVLQPPLAGPARRGA